MNYSKTKQFLEVSTSVAVLLVAIVFLGSFVANFWGTKTEGRQLTSGLQKDQTLPQIQGIDYRSAPRTVIIVVNTECAYCQESLPFYNRLAQLKQEKRSDINLTAVFPNTKAEVNQYVTRNQLGLNAIAEVNLGTINVPATPAILVVDNAGRVENFWLGKLSRDGEEEVVKALGFYPFLG